MRRPLLDRTVTTLTCCAALAVLALGGCSTHDRAGYATATAADLHNPAVAQKARNWCRRQPGAESISGCKSVEVAYYLDHAFNGRARSIAASKEPWPGKDTAFFSASLYGADGAAREPAKQEEEWCGVHAILKANDVEAYQRYRAVSSGCRARFDANGRPPAGAD